MQAPKDTPRSSGPGRDVDPPLTVDHFINWYWHHLSNSAAKRGNDHAGSASDTVGSSLSQTGGTLTIATVDLIGAKWMKTRSAQLMGSSDTIGFKAVSAINSALAAAVTDVVTPSNLSALESFLDVPASSRPPQSPVFKVGGDEFKSS